jgi:hypothetical protein
VLAVYFALGHHSAGNDKILPLATSLSGLQIYENVNMSRGYWRSFAYEPKADCCGVGLDLD